MHTPHTSTPTPPPPHTHTHIHMKGNFYISLLCCFWISQLNFITYQYWTTPKICRWPHCRTCQQTRRSQRFLSYGEKYFGMWDSGDNVTFPDLSCAFGSTQDTSVLSWPISIDFMMSWGHSVMIGGVESTRLKRYQKASCTCFVSIRYGNDIKTNKQTSRNVHHQLFYMHLQKKKKTKNKRKKTNKHKNKTILYAYLLRHSVKDEFAKKA